MSDFDNIPPEQLKKMMEEMQRRENEGLSPEEQEEKKRQKEMEKKKNKEMMEDTAAICEKGSYEAGGRTVSIGLTKEEMSDIKVFLPEDIAGMSDDEGCCCGTADGTAGEQLCKFSCENKAALSLAAEKLRDPEYSEGVLVLNLASATRPGGAVRDGANGQEEDLCRRSTLLSSLESKEASRYYEYNKKLTTHMGSDGVMISPDVVVFRDEKSKLLEEPFRISVISCSAPMIRMGLEGKTEEEYEDMLYGRICGILRCARSAGYKNLILGAFGCGIFGNDAAVVSDAFFKALTGPDGRGFAHVDFAVLCSPGKEYNYNEFCRNFAGGD